MLMLNMIDMNGLLLKVRKKEEKIKVGTKICRFAQFPNDKKAIMPATLQGLLAARKATRSKAKFKTVTMKNGDEHIV